MSAGVRVRGFDHDGRIPWPVLLVVRCDDCVYREEVPGTDDQALATQMAEEHNKKHEEP